MQLRKFKEGQEFGNWREGYNCEKIGRRIHKMAKKNSEIKISMFETGKSFKASLAILSAIKISNFRNLKSIKRLRLILSSESRAL